MEITIDRFGRIVLPKTMRDELDLDAGSVLVVEEIDGAIVLKPVRDEPDLVDDEGVLVFVGKPTGDVEGVARTLRRQRVRALGGWNPPTR